MRPAKSLLSVRLLSSEPLHANGQPTVSRKASVQLSSRTFAYRWLARGLNRVLCGFLNLMPEYLDKVIKPDQCTQYVDDIGIVANDAQQLIENHRAAFKCIHKTDISVTLEQQKSSYRKHYH